MTNRKSFLMYSGGKKEMSNKEVIYVRTSEETKEKIRDKAKNLGMSMSSYLIHCFDITERNQNITINYPNDSNMIANIKHKDSNMIANIKHKDSNHNDSTKKIEPKIEETKWDIEKRKNKIIDNPERYQMKNSMASNIARSAMKSSLLKKNKKTKKSDE